MSNMLRSKRNHKHHTDCEYGCCLSPVTSKTFRAREKQKIQNEIKTHR